MNEVCTAFLALLAAFRVGEGVKPPDSGWVGAAGNSQFRNYLMVTWGRGVTDGSITELDSDIDMPVLITCVSNTAQGCRILSDNVIAALRHKRITTANRATLKPITLEEHGAVRRDDTVTPPVFMAVHEFQVWTTPISPSGS